MHSHHSDGESLPYRKLVFERTANVANYPGTTTISCQNSAAGGSYDPAPTAYEHKFNEPASPTRSYWSTHPSSFNELQNRILTDAPTISTALNDPLYLATTSSHDNSLIPAAVSLPGYAGPRAHCSHLRARLNQSPALLKTRPWTRAPFQEGLMECTIVDQLPSVPYTDQHLDAPAQYTNTVASNTNRSIPFSQANDSFLSPLNFNHTWVAPAEQHQTVFKGMPPMGQGSIPMRWAPFADETGSTMSGSRDAQLLATDIVDQAPAGLLPRSLDMSPALPAATAAQHPVAPDASYCPYCLQAISGKLSDRISNLKRHVNFSCRKSGQRRSFKCSTAGCGRVYSRPDNLKKHCDDAGHGLEQQPYGEDADYTEYFS